MQPFEIFQLTHAHYEGNYIWCTAFHDPYLYKIDVENKTIEEVALILDESDKLSSFILILSYKDYFIFIPSGQDILIMMNRNTLKKEKYHIPNKLNLDESYQKLTFFFANGFIHKDMLYCVGTIFKGILKFDLINKKAVIIDEFLNNLKINSSSSVVFNYNYVKFEDKVYFPFINTNAILELSLNDDSQIVHYVGDKVQRFFSAARNGKDLWLAPSTLSNGNIVKFNTETHTFKQIKVSY